MNDTPLEPFGELCVLLPAQSADTTPGGIVLPDAAKEKFERYAIVMAIGPDALDKGFAVGDRVLYDAYAVNPYESGEGASKITYFLVPAANITARIRTNWKPGAASTPETPDELPA